MILVMIKLVVFDISNNDFLQNVIWTTWVPIYLLYYGFIHKKIQKRDPIEIIPDHLKYCSKLCIQSVKAKLLKKTHYWKGQNYQLYHP